jgi:hypothetical protein
MHTLENMLDALDSAREKLLTAIAHLPDEALLEAEAIGRFSIADVLAMQVAWEAELVTGLMRLDQGKKPERLLQALADPANYNKLRFIENHGRSLDSIFNDYQHVRIQLEDWLTIFSEKALNNRNRFKSLNGRSLAEIIAQVTWQREEKFIEPFAAFARTWTGQQEE